MLKERLLHIRCHLRLELSEERIGSEQPHFPFGESDVIQVMKPAAYHRVLQDPDTLRNFLFSRIWHSVS